MTHPHGEPVQLETPDLAAEQRARLRELFPEAFAEDKVDLEKLRATLGDLVDERPERYTFSWAGSASTASCTLPASITPCSFCAQRGR